MSSKGDEAGTSSTREPETAEGQRSVVAALVDHYRSVDSAPAGFSITRPTSDLNGFIATFFALSVLGLTSFVLLFNLGLFNRQRDLIFISTHDQIVMLPLRLFVVIFFLTYALYAFTNWRRRMYLGGLLIGKFLIACAAIDVVSWFVTVHWFNVTLLAQQIISLLIAMAVFPQTVLAQAQLPAPFTSPVKRTIPVKALALIGLTLAGSLIVALWFEHRYLDQVEGMRHYALLGGIGPGVFLAQQVFTAVLALVGYLKVRQTRRHDFAPQLAVLIPAHNEAHGIGHTISAVDRAAETYRGQIHMYVVDNCSADDTTMVARATIEACEHITGEVLFCGTPGKAIALNYGFEHVREDFVVRIDADTVIGDGCLDVAMRHFSDPTVCSVGGLPLPAENRTAIDHVRLVEVLLRHGFFQVALGGFDAIIGVPGMFAVYRKCAVDEVGGTTEGMNGEDTDICIRMNAVGYRTVADPAAVYYSETPATFAHLQEQRTRWFRSIYHMAAHSKPILLNRHSVNGGVVLPFMLVGAARRAMLAPLLLFAVLVLTVFRGAYPHLPWQPVAAVVIGMPMLMAVFVCILLRRFGAMKYLPQYLIFRMVRSYFTLGSALSLVYPPAHRRGTPDPFGPVDDDLLVTPDLPGRLEDHDLVGNLD